MTRPGRERVHDKCEHGVRMDPDPEAPIRCTACRVLMGEIPATRRPGARRGYCGVPGHEHLKRWPTCSACASEAAAGREPARRPDLDAPIRRAEQLNRP